MQDTLTNHNGKLMFQNMGTTRKTVTIVFKIVPIEYKTPLIKHSVTFDDVESNAIVEVCECTVGFVFVVENAGYVRAMNQSGKTQPLAFTFWKGKTLQTPINVMEGHGYGCAVMKYPT